LRRAFSGIVAGNIKEYGISAIERNGPFELTGDRSIMEPLDQVLKSFVSQGRMKFPAPNTRPVIDWWHERLAAHPLSIRSARRVAKDVFDFTFDAEDFRMTNPSPAEPPFWTELDFNQCANCPLECRGTPALSAGAANGRRRRTRSRRLVSFDTVGVTVVQAERTIYAETSAQQALSPPCSGSSWRPRVVRGPTGCGRWRDFICRSRAMRKPSTAA
jgi:hypothetical protein